MRVWTWATSGPDEPDEYRMSDGTVWDDEDLPWTRHADGRWWPPSDPEVCPEDLFGFPLPWSVLIETRGPLKNKPRQNAPAPTVEGG